MLVTPYLTSMATPEAPRPLVEGGTTSWFQVHRRACLAAGRRFGRSDHRGQGKRYRVVGACVARDTADTVYQSAVELDRSRQCKQESVYDWYLVDIGVDRDFPVLPNGNDSSSGDVARPNVISPVPRPSWHRWKVLRKSFIYPPQKLLRKSCCFRTLLKRRGK